ncbi:MAG TPA: single-stranded DNA-binding protein [bacterium]|nr:single-stranded DNA-binding protein [bacterium]HOL48497.1 single-stranded DNA-binding protein [bacterium]HPQ17658.1 single-stranded DNA-binding protein [bacterium]
MAVGLPYLNKVFIIGNLVRDPKLAYTPNQKAVCRITVAINRRFKVGNETREEVVFIDVVLWGKLAENAEKYLKQGGKVYIEGRLSLNKWQAQDGSNRSKIEIIAERLQFLSSLSDSQNKEVSETGTANVEEISAEESAEVQAFDDEVPF